MRKLLRNQLAELLGSIDEGIREMRKLTAEDVQIVLVDCFNAAVAVEEALERELSQEGFARYSGHLSAFKEDLETVNASLNEENVDRTAIKASRNELKKLSYLLTKEPEVRPEWVFMPYNASMWDALESVWLAAKDRCDCYVVPIPYYERGPGGAIQNECYDGDRFPEYVPVTHYSKYDITVRRPDAVFIHNPYDGNNYVTSVHPDYYIDRLKQYTDMLVYIPYYVLFGAVPDSFTQLPAYKNIDKVIVQSEQVRKAFLKFWPAEKIIALGSPKFDKVISSQENPPLMPEEWARIANGRKLIFYNTTLGALLRHGEQYIRKLRAVIEHFRDDKRFVLLWRPHPLGQATVSSMRPNLLRAYQDVVRDYRESETGIYDDSADLHRAIALSSAYFGDNGSSVAALYAVTGKPVIRQHEMLIKYFDEPGLIMNGICIGKNGDLWTGIACLNALARVDFESGRVKEVRKSEGDFVFGGMVLSVETGASWCVCAPVYGKKIMLIDTENGEVYYKQPEVARRNPATDIPYSFSRVLRFGDDLYLIPYLYQAIIRYNIASCKLEYLTDWIADMKNYLRKAPDQFFYKGVCAVGDRLLLLMRESNTIMEFDTRTGGSRFFDIGNAENRYMGIAFDGKVYWLIPGNAKTCVVRWEYETGQTTEYREFPSGFRSGVYIDVVKYQGDFLLFPFDANMILRLNPETGMMTEFDGLPMNREEDADFQYHFAERHGDWIYAFAWFNRTLYRLHAKTGEVQQQRFQLEPEQYDVLYAAPKTKLSLEKDEIPARYAIQEISAQGSICQFLGALLDGDQPRDFGDKAIFEATAENLDGTAGEKIRDYLMKTFN